ncbi:uncharacterized protein [Drosophila pseudoobscura]|uniref:Uncharacterized protein isoform X1 n=1 Tax=Drosophila pseudoobscura pseudoobscura TaxID=46245 RepID=B5DL61_DROPS|nr:uncharacterized protein LOC6902102 isoform X1 [Drosophila pseudoobscura]
MCDLWNTLIVGLVTSSLGLAVYFVMRRRRNRLYRSAVVPYGPRAVVPYGPLAVVPYGPRAVVRVEIAQPDPFETEEQRAMRAYLKTQARYIHYPPVDMGFGTMPLVYQYQMLVIFRLQGMYRDGMLFRDGVAYIRWPRR